MYKFCLRLTYAIYSFICLFCLSFFPQCSFLFILWAIFSSWELYPFRSSLRCKSISSCFFCTLAEFWSIDSTHGALIGSLGWIFILSYSFVVRIWRHSATLKTEKPARKKLPFIVLGYFPMVLKHLFCIVWSLQDFTFVCIGPGFASTRITHDWFNAVLDIKW
jgi:hypothetical protein